MHRMAGHGVRQASLYGVVCRMNKGCVRCSCIRFLHGLYAALGQRFFCLFFTGLFVPYLCMALASGQAYGGGSTFKPLGVKSCTTLRPWRLAR